MLLRRRRRQHPDPLRAVKPDGTARSPSTGASPPCASRPATSSGPRSSNLLGLRGYSFRDVDQSIVSSTVPAALRAVDADGGALSGPRDAGGRADDPHRDADPLRQPARGRRRPAGQRGGGVRAVQDACVVVDFGTAITYDAVSAAGEYLGGIITPGRRDLDRRSLRPRRQAAQGRAAPSRAR